MSCGAASSTTKPITADSAIVGVPRSTVSPTSRPRLGNAEWYSGSVSRTRPAVQAAMLIVAVTALTGSRSSA